MTVPNGARVFVCARTRAHTHSYIHDERGCAGIMMMGTIRSPLRVPHHKNTKSPICHGYVTDGACSGAGADVFVCVRVSMIYVRAAVMIDFHSPPRGSRHPPNTAIRNYGA